MVLVTGSCYENEFQCNNLRCIRMNERCNQVNNCGDNSDELNCDGQYKTVNTFSIIMLYYSFAV